MTTKIATIALTLLSVGTVFPQQAPLAHAGYSTIEALEVAPAQVVLISTYGIPSRSVRESSVSIPETELAGFRASIRYPGFSDFSVQFLGFRQAGCETSTSAMCEPLTSFTMMMPVALPPLGMKAELVINDRGRDVRTISVRTVPDRVHIVSTCDEVAVSVGREPNEECGQVVRRPVGGQRVTAQNPAKLGETIVIWAYGLGVPGRQIDVDGGRITTVLNLPFVRFAFGSSAAPAGFPSGVGVPPVSVAAFPPTPLYQVNITLPELPAGFNLPLCDGSTVRWNLTVYLSGLSSMDSVRLCVAP